MRRRDRTSWIVPDHKNHEPLVEDELFNAVQKRLAANKRPRLSRQKTSVRTYPLSGRLYCGVCGFSMEADHRKSRSPDGPGWNRYRCRPGTKRSIPEDVRNHPINVYVREAEIIDRLDPWLATLADPQWLARSQ
jgi:hypothetical protein